MENRNLFDEIIKTSDIHFRKIKIGDDISEVLKMEGTPTEEKRYNNPFLSYFYEIGEMEEILVYYNFLESSNKVTEIKLFFISYPDFYWKKQGGTDYIEFTSELENNKIQKYSEAFLQTLDKIIDHFTTIFDYSPSINTTDETFNLPYQNYKSYAWTFKELYRLSVVTYIDDTIDLNVKNTMIIYLRSY